MHTHATIAPLSALHTSISLALPLRSNLTTPFAEVSCLRRGKPGIALSVPAQALAFERLLSVVKTQPVTGNLPPRPRIAELRPVNENIAVSYPVRPPDAHQRVPLEPLFHIDTEAQPAAEPMSIDTASEINSIKSETQTSAYDQGFARGTAPVQHIHAVKTEENGTNQPAHASPIKTESQAQVSPHL